MRQETIWKLGDVRKIGRAELSADMAAYALSGRQIIAALTDAAERDLRLGARTKCKRPRPASVRVTLVQGPKSYWELPRALGIPSGVYRS